MSVDIPADISGLSYEQAREELIGTVRSLEAGNLTLERSLELWGRGEALADHCQAWLDGARTQLQTALAEKETEASSSSESLESAEPTT